MTIEAPLDRYRDRVRPEWIDHNRHMNMGYYMVVFDFATDTFLTWLGLTAEHRRQHDVTTFALEGHINYLREIGEGAALRFTSRLIDHDAKRIHYFHEMWHATEDYLAATNELVTLHVSLATRRSAPMAPDLLARLATVQAAHDRLPRPAQVGRRIGLRAAAGTA